MRRTIIIAAAAATLAIAGGAVPSAASTFAPSRWVCKDHPGTSGVDYHGWTDPNPYIVKFKRSTVVWITHHVGTHDGKPGTEPKYVPCQVASEVADAAMHAWVYNWRGNSGWMGAGWGGAAAGPWYGSFHCIGEEVDSNDQIYQVDCFHFPDRHIGRGSVGVGFLIQPVSTG
jgi:hypothetical protein